jgi:hypothetical protein
LGVSGGILPSEEVCDPQGREVRVMASKNKKEIIGYETEDGNIYCVECIRKNYEQMKEQIENAITADDLGEKEYVCDGCKEEFK